MSEEKINITKGLNEWMRRFIEKPDQYAAEFHTIPAGYQFYEVELVPVIAEEDLSKLSVISLEEARRRAAVANMLIVECEAADALNDAFKESVTPDKAGPRADPRPVWHSKHGWMTHPIKQVENLAAAVEAGHITRAQAAAELGRDIDEVDAENARDKARLMHSISFADFISPETADHIFGEEVNPRKPKNVKSVIYWYPPAFQTETLLVGFYDNQQVCRIRKLDKIHVVEISEQFPIPAPYAGSTYFCGSIEAGKAIADVMLHDALEFGDDLSRYRPTRSF